MDISIVIVNYNVRYFLEKCLASIQESDFDEEQIEIFLVDNASVDGSKDHFPKKYPSIKYIYNEQNLGFGKANNQAIKKASGKYTLILNPDTLISKDTLGYCYQFAESQQNFGALGVKMIDGSGNYLPESKRDFPTMWNSFCKFTRINKIAPNSQLLNGYYAGGLNGKSEVEINVLCGAFMFVETELLQRLNGFDPDFFMYGEDIDLSKRIREEGRNIYYSDKTEIVHFKGESTKRTSINYLKSFYGAMVIYAEKHVKGPSRFLYLPIIKVAVAALSVTRFVADRVQVFVWPIIHFLLSFLAFEGAKSIWSNYYFGDSSYYDSANTSQNYLLFSGLLVFVLYFLGVYEEKYNVKKLMVAIPVILVLNLAVYGLLPLELRSSRMILLIGTLLGVMAGYTLDKLWYRVFKPQKQQSFVSAVVTNKMNREDIEDQLFKHSDGSLAGSFNINSDSDEGFLGGTPSIVSQVRSLKINEIFFDETAVSNSEMIDLMSRLRDKVTFKIWSEDKIIGIGNKKMNSTIYTVGLSNHLDRAVYRRSKRAFDLFVCLLTLILSPLLVWYPTARKDLFSHVFRVLINKGTWVGAKSTYRGKETVFLLDLSYFEGKVIPVEVRGQGIDDWYNQNYTPLIDLSFIVKKIFG